MKVGVTKIFKVAFIIPEANRSNYEQVEGNQGLNSWMLQNSEMICN